MRSAIFQSALTWKMAFTVKFGFGKGFTSSPLTFPMKRTQVKMSFDGHVIKLAIDTGSSKTYLVYGGWYESLYGRGSCKYLISGCYFCPPTDPCDLDTLLSQDVYVVQYADGSSMSLVYRKVTLKVGNRKIKDLYVGLVVNSSAVTTGVQPSAYLGLSSRLTELRAGSRRPSFLQQLVETGAIPHFTVDIRVSRVYHGLTGQLVLGDALPQGEDVTLLPLRNDSFLVTRIAVSAVLVRNPSTSGTWIEANNAKEFHHVTLDTGADFTVVPEIVFERIWAAIEDEFDRDRVESYAYIDAYQRIWFHKDVITRLPVMVVRVGTESTFDVHLSNHWHICEGTWCKLQVIDRLQQDKPLNQFFLGAWFFAEHDVSFDFSRAIISLRSPRRPVVIKTTSTEVWNEFRGPPCKRADERRSGLRRLLGSCTGT